MDDKFLMGRGDWLLRSPLDGEGQTKVSYGLEQNLRRAAMIEAFNFYSEFFETEVADLNFDDLLRDYGKECSEASALGLFGPGGIQQRDHLSLWCLRNVFRPQVYIESGVFTGSSLHAFIHSQSLEKIIAIDPNLSNLKLKKEDLGNADLVDDKDFSQLETDFSGQRSLAYFDDHIDTANRIFQSQAKGIKTLLFDDSTGLEGICQRLYPAIPTVPMIMHAEMLTVGDQLSWTFNQATSHPLKRLTKKLLGQATELRGTRVTLNITSNLINACLNARKLVRKCQPIPSLSSFVPQAFPGPSVDTTKYLVTLN